MKRNYSILLIFLFTLILGTSCSVSKYSNKSFKENTIVSVVESDSLLVSDQMTQPLARGAKSRGLITASMLLKGVSLGTETLKKFIDNEKKKYTAEYTDGISNLYFYNQLSEKNAWDPEGIQLKEFTFIRTFLNKKGKLDTALLITFMLDTSSIYEIYNNAVFRLKVKEIKINYAKAKVPSKHWYIPWSYLQRHHNDKLDLDIEIKFTSTYNTESGIINHQAELGTFYFFVRDAPLNKNDPNYYTYYDSLSNSAMDGYSFIVPRSYGHYFSNGEFKPCYSQGQYAISLSIIESGKEKFVDKIIIDNSSKAIDAITDKAFNLK